jgi:hypothetical protein
MTKALMADKNFKIIKGVKITRSRRKFNPKKLAVSLTNVNLENASVIRKQEWTRKKEFIN